MEEDELGKNEGLERRRCPELERYFRINDSLTSYRIWPSSFGTVAPSVPPPVPCVSSEYPAFVNDTPFAWVLVAADGTECEAAGFYLERESGYTKHSVPCLRADGSWSLGPTVWY